MSKDRYVGADKAAVLERRKKLIEEGLTNIQIGEIEGVHYSTIAEWRRKQKLRSTPDSRRSYQSYFNEDILRKAVAAGRTDGEIAYNYGFSSKAPVIEMRERLGLKENEVDRDAALKGRLESVPVIGTYMEDGHQVTVYKTAVARGIYMRSMKGLGA